MSLNGVVLSIVCYVVIVNEEKQNHYENVIKKKLEATFHTLRVSLVE